MSLNSTPQSVRVHIGLFGKRNSGKSSIINAITNQKAAIVSDIAGTTTDPVFRPIEILPIGPCVLIDTAGLDDVGELGKLRINKSLDVLDKTDIALLVVDSTIGIKEEDLSLIKRFNDKKVPHILILNKIDKVSDKEILLSESNKLVKCPIICVSALNKFGIDKLKQCIINSTKEESTDFRLVSDLIDKNDFIVLVPIICVSALNKFGIDKLKQCIINSTKEESTDFRLVSDLIDKNDFIVLVIPIDKAAPKGRLILPQQQVIRDILDTGAMAIITKETTLKETLANLNSKPTLVITDSQAFGYYNQRNYFKRNPS